MNASELIDQFQHLPQYEQAKVIDFIKSFDEAGIAFAKDEDVVVKGESVFEEHPELFRKLSQ